MMVITVFLISGCTAQRHYPAVIKIKNVCAFDIDVLTPGVRIQSDRKTSF